MDREKVIKGLEACSKGECTTVCPYHNTPRCTVVILEDAIALLKEQEEIIHELQKSGKCVLKNIDTKICGHCKHYGVFPDKEVEPDDNGIRCYCYKHKWLCYPWDECDDFQSEETQEGE